MSDKDLIKLLRVALSIAAIQARNNPPGLIPENMSQEDFLWLYANGNEDIFGEKFVTYWIKEAKKELDWK